MVPHSQSVSLFKIEQFSLESVCKIANSRMSDFSTGRSEIAAEIAELCRQQSLAEDMKFAGRNPAESIAYRERMNRLAVLRNRLKEFGAKEIWSQNWP